MGLGLRGGGPLKAFSPKDISGLTLWLEADRGVTATANRLSAWADQSGAGHDASQATGAQQPLVTTGQNGRTILRGDGVRRIDLTGQGTPTAATWVFCMSGMVGASQAYLCSGNANANLGIVGNFGGAAGVTKWFNSTDVATFATMPNDRSLHVLAVTQQNGVSLKGYYDGALAFSMIPTVALQGLGALLNYITSTGGGSDGDLAGVFCASRVVSDAELAKMTAYFKGRYAIQ